MSDISILKRKYSCPSLLREKPEEKSNCPFGQMNMKKRLYTHFSGAKVRSFLQICKREIENGRFFLGKIDFSWIF